MSVTIQVNALSGAANASGAGPATALTGSNASYSGTTVTLDGSPSLGSVATDGTHVLYLQTSTGRRFFTITGVNDGADTVTVSETIAGTASGLSWAIGGKCSSINTYLQADVKEGWIIELGSNLDISSSLAFNISNFVIKSDVENVVRKIRATGCDAMVFTPAAHNKQLTLQNVKCVTAKSHPSRYYNFDGTDDYVDCGNQSVFDFTSAFSVCFWVRTQRQDTYQMLLAKNDSEEASGWEVQISNNNQLRMTVRGSSMIDKYSGVLMPQNEWVHVVGIAELDGISWYLNNESIGKQSGTWTPVADTSAELRLGSREFSDYKFLGQLADVRLYNGVLDEEEVEAVYQGRSISKTLVAHYKCSDQDDNEAYDSGPNSYHGLKRNITPASFHGEDEPFLTNQFPTVLKFDGVDDVATYSVAHSNPQATAMGWFYIDNDTPVGSYLLTQPGVFSVKEDSFVVAQASPNTTITQAYDFPKDKWFFMTCVADGTNLLIYVDGTLVASKACTDLVGTASAWQVSRNLGYLKGSVGPCRVYDQALTQSEIVSIYNGGKITKKPIIQVGFNEGTGSTTEDEISAERFDLTGSPVWYKKAPYNSNISDYNGIKVAEGNFNDNYLNLVGCVLGDEDEVLKKGLVSYDPNVVCRINNCNIQYCEDGIDSQSMLVGAYNWIHNNTRYGLLTDQSVGISHSLFSKNKYGLVLKDAAMASVQGTHNTFVDNGVASGRLVNGTVVTSGYSSSTALVPTSSRDFDGVDDYLTAGNVLNPLHKDFSVAAWIKSQNDVAMFGPVVGKQDSSRNAHRFYLGQDYDGKVLAGIEGSANATVQSRARTFNGSSDYIILGAAELPDGDDARTLMCWIKSTGTNTLAPCITYGREIAGQRFELGLRNNYLTVAISGSSYKTNTPLSQNVWYHCAVSYEQGVLLSQAKLFINGIEQETSLEAGTSSVLVNTNLAARMIGTSTTPSSYFTGSLCDIRIYGSALSAKSIVKAMIGQLSESTLVHYKLDDPVSSRVLDSSGNGNHGTPVGTTVYTGLDVPTKVDSYSGKLITRYKDLGFDGHVQIADDAAFNLSTNVSASIWAKHHNTSLAATEILISKNGASTQQEWTLYILASKKIRVVLSSDGSTTAVWETTSAYSGDISKWHHYAFTYNSTTTKIYIDGVELAASYVSGSHPASLFNGTAPVELGSHYNTTFNWMGSLADGKIYSQTLTANEVLEDYVDQLPYTPVGRWKLDDLDPNTAVDSGSGGNDATSLSNIRVRVENQVVSYIPKDESTAIKDVLGNVVNHSDSQHKVVTSRFTNDSTLTIANGWKNGIDGTSWNAPTRTEDVEEEADLISGSAVSTGISKVVNTDGATYAKLTLWAKLHTSDTGSISFIVSIRSRTVTTVGAPGIDLFTIASPTIQTTWQKYECHVVVPTESVQLIALLGCNDRAVLIKDVTFETAKEPSTQNNVYHPLERFDTERRCYVFDGSNDQIPTTLDLNQTTVSVSLWVNCSAPVANQPFISNRDASGAKGFWFGRQSTQKMHFYHFAGSPQSVVSVDTIPANEWAHLCYVVNSTTVSLYLNGALQVSSSVSSITANAINDWSIGKDGAGSSVYTGKMADVRVFDSALTADQVKKIYQQQDHLANLPKPKAWYKCDDTGRYALDASGNGYHGTKTNIQTSFHATDSALPFKPNKKTYNKPILHSFSKGAASWNSIAGVSATSGQTNWDGASDAYLLENTSIGGRVLWFRTVPQKCNGVKISVVVKDIDAGPLVRILLRNNTEAVNYVSSDTDVSTLTAGAFAEVVSLGNDWAKITVTKYGEMDPGDEIWFYLYCGTSASAIGTQIYYGQVEIEMLQESPVNAALPYQNVDGDLFDVGQNRLQPCLTFDANSSTVVSSSYSGSHPTSVSLSTWVYIEKDVISRRLMSWGPATPGRGISISTLGPGIFFILATTDSNYTRYDILEGIVTQKWIHLAITQTGTTIKIYLNGVEQSYTTTNGGTGFNGTYGNTFEIAKLGQDTTVGTTFFYGRLADSRFYDVALTPQQISDIYQGLSISVTPKIHWPLTEGQGLTVNDVSGNGNHGVLTNFTESAAWANLQGVYDYNSSYGCKFGIDVTPDLTGNSNTTETTGQDDPNGGTTGVLIECSTTGADSVLYNRPLKGGAVTDFWVKNVSGNRMELGFYNGSTFNRCFGEILSGPGDIQYVSNRFQVYNLTSDWTHIRVWSNMDTTGLYLYPGRHTSGSATDAVVVAFWEVYPTYAAVPYLLDMSAPADGSSILARSGKQLGIAGNASLLPVAQSPRSVRSTTTVNDGAWHHITATADRNGVLSVYVDGTLEGTVSIGSLGNTVLQSLQDFTIGRLGSYFFPGKIGGVQFYDSALSASDVLALSQGTQPLDPTSSWSMVSSGSVEGDSGIAGNSAVINGTTLKTIGPRTASNDCVSLVGSNFTDNTNGIGFNGSPLVLYTNSYGNENADVGTSQSTVGNTTTQPRYTDSTNDKYTPSRTLKDKGPDKIGQDGTTEANVDQGGPQRSEQRVPIVRRNGMNLNM